MLTGRGSVLGHITEALNRRPSSGVGLARSSLAPGAFAARATTYASASASSSSASAATAAAGYEANFVFVLLAFSGHGADIMRREAADSGSDLRHVLQTAIESDVASALSHLLSPHALQCVAGAPATRLVLAHKMDPADTLTNRVGGAALYAAIAVRSTSPQQAATLLVALRGCCGNSQTFRRVQAVMTKVCCARPSRVIGDPKARLPFDTRGLFVHIVRLEEISQNVLFQPRWFADMFSALPTHLIETGTVAQFVSDVPPQQLLLSRFAAASSSSVQQQQQYGPSATVRRLPGGDRAGVHVVYHSPDRSTWAVQQQLEAESLMYGGGGGDQSSLLYRHDQQMQRQRFAAGAVTIVDEQDAMWIPVDAYARRQHQQQYQHAHEHTLHGNSHFGGTNASVASNVHGNASSYAKHTGDPEPFVLSRTTL
jgi:hypothetical protein